MARYPLLQCDWVVTKDPGGPHQLYSLRGTLEHLGRQRGIHGSGSSGNEAHREKTALLPHLSPCNVTRP
ncbi:hypothetical protein NDU88_000739 [Pleurodeles waltl]|uniref:Uncharacterized protein n=1 Tax=Pleurodeles waltl TaxID=8319 RepID=A0AAV7LB05_PLEWA|nr:hypothetical protein NDU88_000739 [Pleurodeles waltl]